MQLKDLLNEKIDSTSVKLDQLEQLLFQYILIMHLEKIPEEKAGEVEKRLEEKSAQDFTTLSQFLEFLFPHLDYVNYVEDFVNKYVK